MFPKIALSITSFIPLYSLMICMYSYVYIYENISESLKKYILIAIGTILILQFICIIIVNRYIGSKESNDISENEISFDIIKEDKKAYVNYMMTYLVPLLTFDLDKVKCFYIIYTNALIIMFVIMNARAENFNFNILLWIKGYYVYKGTKGDSDDKILLIKKKKFSNIRNNYNKYKFVTFGGSKDVYLCKKYDD
ncbi:hypothetical protein FDB52_07670 [Clostridium botulinum]|nr:hypothetical protein [Clostridium botulinum]NFN48426.1 hypothetical protein [Clostridium botulinum]